MPNTFLQELRREVSFSLQNTAKDDVVLHSVPVLVFLITILEN